MLALLTIASWLAVLTIAAAAVFAVLALTGDDADAQATPPLQFTQEINEWTNIWINSRKGQPIDPFVFPTATGGTGRLSYNIAHRNALGDQRKKGPPLGLIFDETTRRLSGRLLDGAGLIWLYYSVSDTSGRTEEIIFGLRINGPVPAGYAPAVTWPELGTLDRGFIRCGVWSEENRSGGTGPPSELYTFRLASPTRLTIDLESEEADAVVQLWKEPHAGENNWENWKDDDGGQGTNSRLSAPLLAARYQLFVSTADDQDEGAYTLRISSPDFIAGNADASQSCPTTSAADQGTSNAADQDATSAADQGASSATDQDTSGGEGSLDSARAGRIVARRLDDGRTEFAWHVEDGDRVLPRQRYLPANPPTGRWLRSSEIIVDGVNQGRINVRVDAETGRIEFAFTPAGGERILPRSRYFPNGAEPGRWLRSTLIEPGG